MTDLDASGAVQSTKGFNAIFIHSSLDDAGLSPQEFRVFAHLSRRASNEDGSCWASYKTMAAKCKMCEDKLKECLCTLVKRNMITRQTRPGATSIWKLNSPKKWDAHPPASNPPVANGGVDSIGDPPASNPRVGNPPEGTPIGKGTKGRQSTKGPLLVTIPLMLQASNRFMAAWKMWENHRREIKEPLTATSAEMQLKQFDQWGAERSSSAIEYTVMKGWRGIREPDKQQEPRSWQRDRDNGSGTVRPGTCI